MVSSKICLALAVMVVLIGMTNAADDAVREVPFKVLYNHDGTYMLTCTHPWRGANEPFIEQILIDSVKELAGVGIDAVAFNPGNGSIPWWQSDVYPDHWQWYTQRTGRKPSSWGQYVMDGGDMVKVFVDTCHQNEMLAFITLRLKDEHGITKLDNEWVSKFFYEHQRWRLDPSPEAPFGVRGLNWIFPEVPQERLRIIEELAGKYDIDGFELDFMRFPPFFLIDQTGYAQRRDVMNSFIRRTREILDQTSKPDQRRYLSIRVPNRFQEYKNLGIDLGYLDSTGWVDIINMSPSYVSQVESDIDMLRAWAPHTAIFYEMTHCSARGKDPTWGRPVGHGDGYPARFTTVQKYYTMANLAYQRGADGMSLFNFIYTRPGKDGGQLHGGKYTPGDPPFGMIKNLHKKEWLVEQAQNYWIPHWWETGYNGRQFQLPQSFVVNTEHVVKLDLALPKQGVASARLRLEHTDTALGLKWKAWINGAELLPCEEVAEPFEDVYGGFLGLPEHYAAWDCPPDILKNGYNQIKFKLCEGPVSEEFSTEIIYVDLAVWPR